MASAGLTRKLAAALLLAELCVLAAPGPIRAAGGLALGLILPGLVICRILADPRIKGVEHVFMVPGMSIAIAIMGGLALDVAGISLTTDNWALALGLFVAAGIGVIGISERDKRADRGSEDASWIPRDAPSGNGRATAVVALLPMAAIATLGAAGAIWISAGGQHYRGPGFTELWALPGARPSLIRLGVVSHELHRVRYTIHVTSGGREVRALRITLRPGQSWQSTQTVTGGQEVEVSLLKGRGGPIYRRVDITAGSA